MADAVDGIDLYADVEDFGQVCIVCFSPIQCSFKEQYLEIILA